MDVDVFTLQAQLEATWPDQPRPYRTPQPPRPPLHLQNPRRSLPSNLELPGPKQGQRVTRQQVKQWTTSRTQQKQEDVEAIIKLSDTEESSEPNLRRGHRHKSNKHPLHAFATAPQQVLTHKTQILEDVFQSIEDDARRNFQTPRATRHSKMPQEMGSL